jgi:hypothetical protein
MLNWFTHMARETAPRAFPQNVNQHNCLKLELLAMFAAPLLHDTYAPHVYLSEL